MRYIAFDVETPNAQNDRMSAIGVAVIEGEAIVEEFYSLVNARKCRIFATFVISNRYIVLCKIIK